MPASVATIMVSTGPRGETVSAIDPVTLAEQCDAQGVPTAPWFGRVNAVTFGVGPDAGFAELLLPFSILRDFYRSLPGVPNSEWESNQYSARHLSIGLTDADSGETRWTHSFLVADVKSALGHDREYQDDTVCYVKLHQRLQKPGSGYNAGGNSGTFAFPDAADTLVVVEPPEPAVEDYDGEDVGDSSGPCYNIPKLTHHAVEYDSDAGVIHKELYEPQSLFGDNYALASPGIETGRPFWTWQQMYSSVATGGTSVTDANELPYSPAGKPIDWDFSGTDPQLSKWAILDRLGCTIKPVAWWFEQLSETTLYSNSRERIVEIGGDDPDFNAALEEMSPALIADYLPWNYTYGVPAPALRVKNIPVQIWFVDEAEPSGGDYTGPGVGEAAVEYGHTYDALYYSFSDVPTELAVPVGFSSAEYFSRHYGGNSRSALIDHDAVLFSFGVSGKSTLNDDLNPTWFYASLQENASRYVRQFWAEKSMHRCYTGFHCREEIMPGAQMKVVRFEDTGKGPRTWIYRGEKFYFPHTCYYAANPHRRLRRDAVHLPSLENVDLSRLM